MFSDSAPISKTLKQDEEDPENSPNKRLKFQNSPSSGKGKSKIEDESSFNCCGICLSENGKSIRGSIDSCDHYFCFVCIMEWAKIESLCPLCKQRFSAIRRPPKDGVFAAERIVNIPVRDQAYHHFGIVTTGPYDPYSDAKCTVCRSNADDCYLLLCDLCDSASHTYCVGLGYTVPEGDWYCQDCTLLRDEHAKDDKDLGGVDRNWGNQASFRKSIKVSHAVLDIVREPDHYDAERSLLFHGRLQSPLYDDEAGAAETIVEQRSQAESVDGGVTSQSGARTLLRCRDVHGRIHALRENWEKIREGSLSISSIVINQQEDVAVSNGNLSQSNTGTRDIDKAWKMMDVAKSIEKKRNRTSSVHCALNGPKHPSKNVNFPKESISVRSKVPLSGNNGNKNCAGIKLEKHNRDCAVNKNDDKHKFHMFRKEKPFTHSNLEHYPHTHPVGSSNFSPSTVIQYSVQAGTYHRNCVNLRPNELLGKFSNDSIKNYEPSACHSTVSVAETVNLAKQDLHISSSCNLAEETKDVSSCVDDKAQRDSDAKSEIQTLVKINLKLLTGDRKLDTKAFKGIARLATHSILATCGIGHPKPGIRSFPSSICNHLEEGQQIRRSTLMPNSCRECFLAFVTDVVNTIMLEKISRA